MKQRNAAELVRLNLGQNLKKIRISRGYKQIEFANILGIKQGALSQLESGTKGFTSETLADISSRLSLHPSVLLAPADSELLRDLDSESIGSLDVPIDDNHGDRARQRPEKLVHADSTRGSKAHHPSKNQKTETDQISHKASSEGSKHLLSKKAIKGPLTAKDCASILSRFADISPERRAVVLGILFDDASLVPESPAGLLQLLSTIG